MQVHNRIAHKIIIMDGIEVQSVSEAEMESILLSEQKTPGPPEARSIAVCPRHI